MILAGLHTACRGFAGSTDMTDHCSIVIQSVPLTGQGYLDLP